MLIFSQKFAFQCDWGGLLLGKKKKQASSVSDSDQRWGSGSTPSMIVFEFSPEAEGLLRSLPLHDIHHHLK